MTRWNDYLGTFKKEDEHFQLARSGDVAGLDRLRLSRIQLNVPNEKGYAPLMLAAYNGQADMVRYLISRGVDVASPDAAGNTVLMGAAFKGELEIVRILVDAGAEIETPNAKGQTALDFSTLFGRADVALYLKSKLKKKEVFGLRDIVAGWISFLFPKRRHPHG